MKTKLVAPALAAALLFATAATLPARSRPADKSGDSPKTTLSVQQKEYKLNVTRAMPTSGKSVPLTHQYSLSVRGDSVISDLPYFGRAYSLPYDGGEGLRFTAPITDYKQEQAKKSRTVVTFNARTKEDGYTFRIEFFPNDRAHIRIHPNKRQGIGFTGTLAE